MPFALEPLVAGQLGTGTVMDTSVHPPRVSEVEYVLDAPVEDDLIESFPVFLASDKLARDLEQAPLTGFSLEGARVMPSEEFRAAYGNAAVRQWRWLRLMPEQPTDCWLGTDYRLCVSDTMFAVLEASTLAGCEVERISE